MGILTVSGWARKLSAADGLVPTNVRRKGWVILVGMDPSDLEA